MKEILEIIKNQRKIKKISQEEMALKIGIARTSYQAIELGKVKLTFEDFLKIIKILDLPINVFTDKKLIVITEDDLKKINKATELLEEVTSKLSQSSSINIGSNNNIQIGNNNRLK